MASRLLEGLRVVELAEVWAGPMAGSLFGDLGADVVKVESYPRNSQTRTLVETPGRTTTADGPPYERSAIHHLANRNKRNIAVNLRNERSVEPFRRLVASADLVFESYSAGTLEGMGWGWEVVHGINPRAVMISAPGWGAQGLYQGYVTLGSGLDASSGHTSVRGYPGDPPENTRPIFHSDATGALTIVFAAIAALRRREATGEGCFVDISQIEALTWQLPGLLGEWTMNARVAPPLGNADPYVVPHDVYRALGDDSWVLVAAEDDEQWAGLARLIGHAEWAERNHAFASVVGRLRGRSEIDETIAGFARVRSSFETAEAVQAAGAIAAPATTPPEFMANEQIMTRGWLQTVTHRYAGTNLMPGFLWSVAPDPPTWDRPSGLVGEHNVEVLTELGFTAAEIEALERDGVIGNRYALPG